MKPSIAAPAALALLGLVTMQPAVATPTPFSFSTGNPDLSIATASRPAFGSAPEIESADDFILSSRTSITSATFTGLIPSGSSVSNVVVEIYRVFPNDSNVGRTSGPPTFSTPNVPTRVNSPSDVAFQTAELSAGELTFTTTPLASGVTALNSVKPGGISLGAGGNGPVTGNEVQFNIALTHPFDLLADHYFFVPQVLLSSGDFLWLSAPRPITGGTGPFNPDLQSWTRDDPGIAPDWMRIGTDIVDGATPPTFNAAFSLTGVVTPEPAPLALLGTGLLGLLIVRRSRTWTRRP